MIILTEIGDFSRFPSAREYMAYLGLVPSENSSGERRRQGGITKTGNRRVRRILVEAAHSSRYRGPAGKTVRARREAQPAWVTSIAERADRRLSARYHHLLETKPRQVVITAVARELAGFIWSIMRLCDSPPCPKSL